MKSPFSRKRWSGTAGDPVAADDAVSGVALRGGLAMLTRQAVAHLLQLLATLLLARLLLPEAFGVVAIALFLQGALAAISSLGLGASLVQRVEPPDLEDERAVLGAQVCMSALLAGAVWVGARWLAPALGAPGSMVPAPGVDGWISPTPGASGWISPTPGAGGSSGSMLFQCVAVAVLLAPLQTVPIARLERKLRLGLVALVEVVQATVYAVVAVAAVWLGYGLDGVGVAIVARTVIGIVLANAASPWRMGVAWSPQRLSTLARFGIPFQAAVWLSLAKDSVTPLLIGAALGATAVGYVTWAQTVSTWPSLVLMVLQRVYVPAFARLQTRRRDLSFVAETAVGAANAVAAPLAVLLLVLLDPMVELVFGPQWVAATDLFLLLWCANLIVPTVTPLVGLLNGVGRARTALGFSLLWTVGTWVLAAPLVLWLGEMGYGVANLLVQLSGFWLVRTAREVADLRILPLVAPSWLVAAAMGGLVSLALRLRPIGSIEELLAAALVALFVYALVLAVARPAPVRRIWDLLRRDPAGRPGAGTR